MNETAFTGIRAVFCDVGGPIYDDENFLTAVIRALDEMRAEHGGAAVDIVDVRRTYDAVRAKQTGSLRGELAERFLGDRSLRGELHERTRTYWTHPQGSMYGDVLPFFRALKKLEPHVVTGVLANQEASVIDALRRDGVGDLIDVWGISVVVGHEKPSSELFAWCLNEAHVAPSEAVHVGNRLDTDVRPAKALGLRTVWVLRGEAPDNPTPEQLAEPDLAVRTLDGLADRILAPTARGGAQ